MPELLDAVTVLEEVSSGTGETVGSVDLTTVSQQLDQVITWQAAQLFCMAIIAGILVGIAVAKIIGRLWQ